MSGSVRHEWSRSEIAISTQLLPRRVVRCMTLLLVIQRQDAVSDWLEMHSDVHKSCSIPETQCQGQTSHCFTWILRQNFCTIQYSIYPVDQSPLTSWFSLISFWYWQECNKPGGTSEDNSKNKGDRHTEYVSKTYRLTLWYLKAGDLLTMAVLSTLRGSLPVEIYLPTAKLSEVMNYEIDVPFFPPRCSICKRQHPTGPCLKPSGMPFLHDAGTCAFCYIQDHGHLGTCKRVEYLAKMEKIMADIDATNMTEAEKKVRIFAPFIATFVWLRVASHV